MSYSRSKHSTTPAPSMSFAEAACIAHHGKDKRTVKPNEPLPGQVPNKSGGFVYEILPQTYARRLLIMGTAGNTYYSTANELTSEAVSFVVKEIEDGNGMMLLDTLKDVHRSGAAPKMSFTLSLLGVLTRCKDDAVRKAALDFTVYGLRTNSQLYIWLNNHINSAHGKGFGRGPKKAISLRYHNPMFEKHVPTHVMETDPHKYWPGMTARQFAYQVTKYAQRDNISMKDVASLVHFKPSKLRRPKVTKEIDHVGKVQYKNVPDTGGVTPGYVEWPLSKQVVLAWVKKGIDGAFNLVCGLLNDPASHVTKSTLMGFTVDQFTASLAGLDTDTVDVLSYLWAVDRVKDEFVDVSLAIDLITRFNLPREVIATPLLTDERVWIALLLKDPTAENLEVNMPITAFIRNLGTMSARGLFNVSQGTPSRRAYTQRVLKAVLTHLGNKDVIVKGRVHPASVISALRTYSGGKALKGTSTWPVCRPITDQLNNTVDIAYSAIKPTGKNELHVIDVSGSMTSGSSGIEGLNACEAASIEMLARLRAARRSEFDSRVIVARFDVGSSVVYDSDPNESAIKMNAKMVAHLDSVYNKMGIKETNRAYKYSYGGYGHSPSLAKPVARNLFDPLTATYDDVWHCISRNQEFSCTDCAQPILLALAMHHAGVASPEVIYVYTDNETNCGSVHASVAMDEYCKYVPHAKLVVVAATPTKFSIGRDGESRILNVAGLDTGASNVIYDFVTDGKDGVKNSVEKSGVATGGAEKSSVATSGAEKSSVATGSAEKSSVATGGAEKSSVSKPVQPVEEPLKKEMKSSWWLW